MNSSCNIFVTLKIEEITRLRAVFAFISLTVIFQMALLICKTFHNPLLCSSSQKLLTWVTLTGTSVSFSLLFCLLLAFQVEDLVFMLYSDVF